MTVREHWKQTHSISEMRSFVEHSGSKIQIQSSNGTTTINGKPAVPVHKGDGWLDSHGAYFYTPENGQPRIVKLLSLDPETFDHSSYTPDMGREKQHSDFIDEIANAYLAEKHGGAKLYKFGFADTANGRLLYLEMEKLFPARNGFTASKDLTRESKLGLRRHDLVQLKKFPGGNQLITTEANMIMDLLDENVAPDDIDFAISNMGEIRWLDSGRWRIIKGDHLSLFDEFDKAIRKFLPTGHLPGQPEFDREEAAAAHLFIHQILLKLKHSTSFTEAEKQLFIETIFREKPSYAQKGVTQSFVLYESGFIRNHDYNSVNAIETMKTYYTNLK